jgi:hypothetical protein
MAKSKSAVVYSTPKLIIGFVLVVIGLFFTAIILKSLGESQDTRSKAAELISCKITQGWEGNACIQKRCCPAGATMCTKTQVSASATYSRSGSLCYKKECCPAGATMCKLTQVNKSLTCSCGSTGCYKKDCCGPTNCVSTKVTTCSY